MNKLSVILLFLCENILVFHKSIYDYSTLFLVRVMMVGSYFKFINVRIYVFNILKFVYL